MKVYDRFGEVEWRSCPACANECELEHRRESSYPCIIRGLCEFFCDNCNTLWVIAQITVSGSGSIQKEIAIPSRYVDRWILEVSSRQELEDVLEAYVGAINILQGRAYQIKKGMFWWARPTAAEARPLEKIGKEVLELQKDLDTAINNIRSNT